MSKTCIPNGQNKKDLKTGLLKFGLYMSKLELFKMGQNPYPDAKRRG